MIVADNLSTDGTFDILSALAAEDDRLLVRTDEERAYFQSQKTTRLAMEALERGHRWIVPCDADEWWYAPDQRRIADYLAGVPPDTMYVEADLYNHLTSALDPPAECERCDSSGIAVSERLGESTIEMVEDPCSACSGLMEPNPVRRIGWMQREPAPLQKVACRLRPGLVIRQGNHSAWAPGTGLTIPGLRIRHFSWRSPEQYLRKIRTGSAAYAASDLPADAGGHWRMWDGKPDEAVIDHYHQWFWSADPGRDDSLVYDPAPGA